MGSCTFLVNRWKFSVNLLHYDHLFDEEVARECPLHRFCRFQRGWRLLPSASQTTDCSCGSSPIELVARVPCVQRLLRLSTASTAGTRLNSRVQGNKSSSCYSCTNSFAAPRHALGRCLRSASPNGSSPVHGSQPACAL